MKYAHARICVVWGLLAVVVSSQAAEPAPLSLANVETLLQGGVSQVDVMLAAKRRRVGFVVDDEAVRRLQALGAGSRLLVELSSRSIPLQADLAAADALLRGEQYAEAERAYSALLAKSPRLAVALVSRGVARLRRGAAAEAAKDFDEYLRDDASNPGILLLRGEAREKLSRFDLALKDYEQALASGMASESMQTTALAQRGRLLMSMGRYDAARAGFVQFIETFPANADAYVGLSILQSASPLAATRHLQAALELAEVAVELTTADSPSRAAAWDALATAYASQGEFDQAVKTQNQAVALAGDEKATFQERLELYRKRKPFHLPEAAVEVKAASADKIAQVFLDDLVAVKGGTFRMGSDWYENDERPIHQVTLNAFHMMAHEVTRGQWAMVTGKAVQGDPKLPVDGVSWDECQQFIATLNKRMGQGGKVFRLPTEAEWEYAARCGTKTAYPWGDSAKALGDNAWYEGNAERKPHTVGTRKKNAWGLYDLHGNVAEWCENPYGPYPKNAVKNPGREAAPGALRVFRGGGYSNSARMCRSTARGLAPNRTRRSGLGFRLVADQTPALKKLAADVKTTAYTLETAIRNVTRALVRDDSFSARRSLIQLQYIRGHLRLKQVRHPEAAEDFARILQISSDAKLDYAVAARCHLAWIRATAKDGKDRDGATAMAYAERSNMLLYNTPWSWMALTSLAAAHAERDEFAKAIERAKQARDRAPKAFREVAEKRLQQLEGKRPLRSEPPLLPLPELKYATIKAN